MKYNISLKSTSKQESLFFHVCKDKQSLILIVSVPGPFYNFLSLGEGNSELGSSHPQLSYVDTTLGCFDPTYGSSESQPILKRTVIYS